MVSIPALAALSLIWVGMLFAVAYWSERRVGALQRWRPLLYTLSLGVYCSSWAFYGTVGQAAAKAWVIPPTYVGTILLFVFGGGVLRKLYELTKRHNITSIADWISARYGKSSGLATAVTVIALFGIAPYIALQLKAIALGFELAAGADALAHGGRPIWADGTFYIAAALAVFAVLFGTRKVDATEHQHGLVVAMAFESVLKLAALWTVGIGICFFVSADPASLFALDTRSVTAMGGDLYLGMILLGALAMFCLPRQFHVGFVECMDRRHIRTALWGFPLYLVGMSIFILPLARAGLAAFPEGGMDADTFVLAIPAASGHELLTVVAFIGGLSAATSMVIMASVALAIMLSNDVLVPIALRRGWLDPRGASVTRAVLVMRRVAIGGLFFLAYVYYRYIAGTEALASIGALAFAAVAQFGPAIVAGMYWRRANRRGAYAGLIAGFGCWVWTLMVPNLVEAGWLSAAVLRDGPLGMTWARPDAMLGLEGLSPLTHGVVVSLLVNTAVLAGVSLITGITPAERRQASGFVGEEPATAGDWPARARIADLEALLEEFFGGERVEAFRAAFADSDTAAGREAEAAMLDYVERQLAAVVGASSARLLLETTLRGRRMGPETLAAIVGDASQTVRFSQRVLTAAFDNLDQGVSVIDADLRLVAWNQRYLELLDYPPGFVQVGRPVEELIRYNAERGMCGPGPVEAHVRKRVAHLQKATPYVFERRHADGRVLELRGNPIPGGGFVTSFSDITEHRRNEQELKRINATLESRVAQRTAQLTEAKAEAERANAAKTRFLAAVSHDLFQPLNAAQLFNHSLIDRADDRATRETLCHIDNALGSVESLLGGLLDISRLDTGGLKPVVEPFALGELLDSLAVEYDVLARDKGLALHVVSTGLWIDSDRQLLRRVVQNFLANAVRYTERGRLLLGARRRGDCACIQVLDTGPGIPADEQARIFEEFERLGRDAQDSRGSGLGLAIAKGIADLLGHRIELRSTPGAGTMFGVIVPLAQRRAAQPSTLPQRSEDTIARVLCIDDEPTLLKALTELLDNWGCRTAAARDWDEAIAAIAEIDPDLILADYHLAHGRNGLNLIGALRTRLQREVPAAVVTADHSESIREAVRTAGLQYLTKPVKPMALRGLVQRIAVGS